MELYPNKRTFNSQVKILYELYLPKIVDCKIIFAHKPLTTHQKFIDANYNKILKMIKEKTKR